MTAKEAIEKLKTYQDQNEPVFILRGRDPLTADAILYWALRAVDTGVNRDKRKSALQISDACDAWQPKKLPD